MRPYIPWPTIEVSIQQQDMMPSASVGRASLDGKSLEAVHEWALAEARKLDDAVNPEADPRERRTYGRFAK